MMTFLTKEVREEFKNCQLCPRKCGINRYQKLGYCRSFATLRVARASLHFWEEPCISGQNGSGTIFFSGCNLSCEYCQNYKVSRGFGKDISVERLSQLCLNLQEQKAHNINLVTPTHYAPLIKEAIYLAKKKGLSIPIVYNTSGYEISGVLKSLRDTVDVYLTDCKYYEDRYAATYSKAPHYFTHAISAIDEMVAQKPIKMKQELMVQGVIIRILLLPNLLEDAKKIVKTLFERYGHAVYFSIMNQYTCVRVCESPELNASVEERDYQELVDFAYDLGIRNAFIQEGEVAVESFIPEFDGQGV